MLKLMPCLSKLTNENLVPLNIEGIEDKFMIVNAHMSLKPYCPEAYSKCIIRIPEKITEEITIFPYPKDGKIPHDQLINLFTNEKMDDGETPRSNNKDYSKEVEKIRHITFTAQGSKMKLLLYENEESKLSIESKNDRAKAVFMTRDERVFRMSNIKNIPKSINFITNEIFDSTKVGESEIINGDVLLVVEQ